MSLSTRCPHCGKSLKLKSRSAIGKAAPCPTCGEVFTIEVAAAATASRRPGSARPEKKTRRAAAENADDAAGFDDFDDLDGLSNDFGDDWEAEDYGEDAGDDLDDFGTASSGRRTRSRSARGGKKGRNTKSRSKSGSGFRQWAPIAGGVAVALLLIGGIAAALLSGLGGENVFDLTWVPEDAEILVRFDPAGMANSAIAKKATEIPLVAAALEAIRAQVGDKKVGVADISEVVLTATDAFPEYRIPRFTGGSAQLQREADPKLLVIIRFNRDFTLDDLYPPDDPTHQRVEKNGHQCVKSQTPDGQPAITWLADGRTLIAGTESMVTAAMNRGPKEPRLKRFDFARPMVDHHVLAILAPEKAASVMQQPTGTDPASKLQYALDKHATGMLAGLRLTSDVDLTFGVNCRDGSGTKEIESQLRTLLAAAKVRFQQTKGDMASGPMAGAVAPFVTIAEEAVNSLQVRTDGRLVLVQGRLSGRIVDEAKKALETNPMLAGMSQVLITRLKAQARTAQKSGSGSTPRSTSAGGSPGAEVAENDYSSPGTPSAGGTPDYTTPDGPMSEPSVGSTPESYGSDPSAAPATPGGSAPAGSYDKPPESTPQTPMSVAGGSYDTPPDGTPMQTPMGTPGSYDAPPGSAPGIASPPGAPPRRPDAVAGAMQRPGPDRALPNGGNLKPNGEPDPAMTVPPEQAGAGAVGGNPARPGAPNAPEYVRVDIVVRSFRGSGSVEKAAMRALGRVIGIRKDTIRYDRDRHVLSFVQKYDEKVFNNARMQLARARIQLGPFQTTPVVDEPQNDAGAGPNANAAAPDAANRSGLPGKPQRGVGSPAGSAPPRSLPPQRPDVVPPGSGSAPGGPGSAPGEPATLPAPLPPGAEGSGSQP